MLVPDFGCLAGQHGTSGTLGIDGIALAFLVSQLAVGSVDLQHGMTAFIEEAGQASTIGAGALDPDCPNSAQRCRPGLECLISLAAGRDGRAGQVDAERADSGNGVNVFVGVDADDDVGWFGVAHCEASRPVARA